MESRKYLNSSRGLTAVDLKVGRDMQSGTSSVKTVEDEKALDLYNLEPFYVDSFASILENTIEELMILGSCNTTFQLINIEANKTHLLHDKYGMERTPVEDERLGISHDQLGKQEYKLKKLIADRLFLQDTVSKTYTGLALSNSFESLSRQIAVFHDRTMYRARLAEEETTNRAMHRDLMRQLRVQQNHLQHAKYEMDLVIDSLRARIEDSSIFAKSRSQFAGRWQTSRSEQHQIFIRETQAKPRNNVMLYKQKISDEQRVHSDIMLLSCFDIDEKLNEVDEVMIKYDKHIENMDLQIQIMKNNYEVLKETKEELQEKYNNREKQIQGWVSFTRAREDARLQREKMKSAATAVQAWWRGLLVRKQLGPYMSKKKGVKRKK